VLCKLGPFLAQEPLALRQRQVPLVPIALDLDEADLLVWIERGIADRERNAMGETLPVLARDDVGCACNP
jgi:hypothetical protein